MASPNWDKLLSFLSYGNDPTEEQRAQVERIRFAYEQGSKEERTAIQEVMNQKERENWQENRLGDPFGISAITGIGNRYDERDMADWRASQEAEAKAKQKAASDDAQRNSLTARLQQYVQSLQGAPSKDDPVMQGLTSAGVDAGQRAYGMSGFGRGGSAQGQLSNAYAQRMALPYLQQRAGLAAQGMGLLNQRDLGLGQLQLGVDQLGLQRQQMQNQMAMQGFGAAQNAAGAGFSALGAGLSAIPGIALAPLTGGASLSLIPAGAQLFGGLGKSGVQWNGSRGWDRNGGGTH